MAHVLSQATIGTATGPAATGVAQVAATLRLWASLWSERRALDTLDTRMLRDIGLSEEEVRSEASRAMWDVPSQRVPHC